MGIKRRGLLATLAAAFGLNLPGGPIVGGDVFDADLDGPAGGIPKAKSVALDDGRVDCTPGEVVEMRVGDITFRAVVAEATLHDESAYRVIDGSMLTFPVPRPKRYVLDLRLELTETPTVEC